MVTCLLFHPLNIFHKFVDKKQEVTPKVFRLSILVFSNPNNDFPKIFMGTVNNNAFNFKIKLVKYEPYYLLATKMTVDKNADMSLILD